MKYIGIVGSRRRNRIRDYKLVEKAFVQEYQDGDIIVSGGCRQGADRFAEDIARKYGVPILIYHTDWGRYGKSAGFVRNGSIVIKAYVLIACVANDRTGGTEDTIKKFQETYGQNRKVVLV